MKDESLEKQHVGEATGFSVPPPGGEQMRIAYSVSLKFKVEQENRRHRVVLSVCGVTRLQLPFHNK